MKFRVMVGGIMAILAFVGLVEPAIFSSWRTFIEMVVVCGVYAGLVQLLAYLPAEDETPIDERELHMK